MAYVNFGSRYYDPVTGVFMAVDPQDQFFNAYSYVGGNPVMMIDPNGEIAGAALGFWIGMGTGAIIGGAVGYHQTGDFSGALMGAGIGAIAGGLAGYGIGSLHDYATSLNTVGTVTQQQVTIGSNEGLLGVAFRNSKGAGNGFGHIQLFTITSKEVTTFELGFPMFEHQGLIKTSLLFGNTIEGNGNVEKYLIPEGKRIGVYNGLLGLPNAEAHGVIPVNATFLKVSLDQIKNAQNIASGKVAEFSASTADNPAYNLYRNACPDIARPVFNDLGLKITKRHPRFFIRELSRAFGVKSGSF